MNDEDEIDEMPKTVPTTRLRAVAEATVRRFKSRPMMGGPNVRVDECERYLTIWEDILDSAMMQPEDEPFPLKHLKPNELEEVTDAYVSGKFDE